MTAPNPEGDGIGPRELEAIAHNLCSLHDFDPTFVAGQERFARAVITEWERVNRRDFALDSTGKIAAPAALQPSPAAPDGVRGKVEQIVADGLAEFAGRARPSYSNAAIQSASFAENITNRVLAAPPPVSGGGLEQWGWRVRSTADAKRNAGPWSWQPEPLDKTSAQWAEQEPVYARQQAAPGRDAS